MSSVDIIELAVCTVCIQLMANGEFTDSTDTAQRCAHGQVDLWGANTRHLVAGHSGDEWFSGAACQGCGHPLAGTRHQAYAVIPT